MITIHTFENKDGKERNQLLKELRESERYNEKYSEEELKKEKVKNIKFDKLTNEFWTDLEFFISTVDKVLEKYVSNEIYRKRIKNALLDGYNLPKGYYEYTSKTTISINIKENIIVLEWHFSTSKETEKLIEHIEFANKTLVEKGKEALKEALKEEFSQKYRNEPIGLCGGFHPVSPFILIRRANTPLKVKKESNYLSVSQFFYLDQME